MATKSRSTSLDGLIFIIAAIILVMAVLLLVKNGTSPGPVDRAASFLAKNDAFSGPVERKATALTRAIANTAIPRPSSGCRKRYIMLLACSQTIFRLSLSSSAKDSIQSPSYHGTTPFCTCEHWVSSFLSPGGSSSSQLERPLVSDRDLSTNDNAQLSRL